MTVIGGILAVVALLISFALQSHHHKETGVWMTRSQSRYVRRRAGKLGVPEHQVNVDSS